jgi:peroxiredoxin
MKQLLLVPLSISLVFLASCASESKQQNDTASHPNASMPPTAHAQGEGQDNRSTAPMDEQGPLAKELAARVESFSTRAPEDVRSKYAAGLKAVIDAETVEKAIQVGQKAPLFQLKNATGEEVALSTLLKDGPVILMWYRGGWCPYCNLAVLAMQKRLPDFQAKGAQLVAISPELPDNTLSTSEKNDLKFNVLSDPQNKVADMYRVIFELTPDVAQIYQEKFKLHEWNGDSTNKLPLSATYVIAQDGTVQWAFLDADYRKRAEPDDILEALDTL